MPRTLIPLGRRTIRDNGSTKYINIPADIEDYGIEREGELMAYLNAEEGTIVYRPTEEWTIG